MFAREVRRGSKCGNLHLRLRVPADGLAKFKHHTAAKPCRLRSSCDKINASAISKKGLKKE